MAQRVGARRREPREARLISPGSLARDPANAAASVAFGAALAIGLAGAFVGLATSSYWFDELFTEWVIGADNVTSFLARALSDAHPPTYYLVAGVWSLLAGPSDSAIRLLSALCAVSAVGIFVWRMPASLNARLFAGALATSSIFWFYQSQNARNYALGLLFLTLLFTRCLAELKERDAVSLRRLGVTAALLEAAAMTHLYMFFTCLAVVGMMFLLKPRGRLQYLALGALLFATAGAYYLLIIPRYSQFIVGKTWIPANAAWVVGQGIDSIKQTYGVFGLLAVAVCALVLARDGVRAIISGEDFLPVTPRAAATIFCFGVPALTFAGAEATSVITPTFTARNFLVVSPFLWGLTACIYDFALSPARRFKPLLVGTLAVLTALSATIVLARVSPHNEPYKEAALWIRQHRECAGASVPVISLARPSEDERAFRRTIEENSYAYYLRGFARPVTVFIADLESGQLTGGLKTELARRAQGHGCPVIAWVSHGVTDEAASALAASIEKVAAVKAGSVRTHEVRVQTVGLHDFAMLDKLFAPNSADTLSSFVFYIPVTERPSAPSKPAGS